MPKSKPSVTKKAAPPTVPLVEKADAPQPAKKWPYIGLVISGVIVLLCTAGIAIQGTMPGWEKNIFTAINGAYLPGWVTNQLAKPVSNAVWGIVALMGVLLLVPAYRLRAWQYAAAGGGAFVTAFVIEHIINRARPAGLGLGHDLMLRAAQDGPGFPSGHVSVLTALCLTVWIFVTWPWRIVLILFVLAMAWSRIYLGVHAPLDVVGGVSVACLVVGTLHLLPSRLRSWLRLR